MVGGVVDTVDADGIDTEFRELGDIAGARLLVGDGVDEFGGAAGLVVDAADVEAGGALHECWEDVRDCVDGVRGGDEPLPLTVMGWREDEEEEDRAASSSVGDGRAKTVEIAANAAIVLNPFMLIYIFKNLFFNKGNRLLWYPKWSSRICPKG